MSAVVAFMVVASISCTVAFVLVLLWGFKEAKGSRPNTWLMAFVTIVFFGNLCGLWVSTFNLIEQSMYVPSGGHYMCTRTGAQTICTFYPR